MDRYRIERTKQYLEALENARPNEKGDYVLLEGQNEIILKVSELQMTKCKTYNKEYSINPVYSVLIWKLGVHGHHLEQCIECLKKDDDYRRYCSKVFLETKIDICVY